MRTVALMSFAALAGGVFAGFGASPAQAQNVDLWQSPSGNIRCAYVNQTGLGCYTRHDGRWAVIRSFGGSAVFYSRNSLPRGRVLRYGATWRRSTFRCQSRRDGMRCWSTHTGRGFHISRETAYSW